MFASLKRSGDDKRITEDEFVRGSSPRSIALSINRLEKNLAETLGVYSAQRQELVNELALLPAEDTEEPADHARRDQLKNDIAKLEAEMLSLRSGKIAEYLSLDRSIGSRRLGDIEKMKKACLPYTKIKV
jgi:hypothetical protein